MIEATIQLIIKSILIGIFNSSGQYIFNETLKQNPELKQKFDDLVSLLNPLIEKILKEQKIGVEAIIRDPELLNSYTKKILQEVKSNPKIMVAVRDIENYMLPSDWLNMCRFYKDQGFYQQAKLLYEKYLPEVENRLGKNSKIYAVWIGDLGLIYSNLALYVKAKPLLTKALEFTKLLNQKEENYLNLAICYKNLAVLHSNQEDYTNAEKMFQKALELRKCRLGEDHSLVLDSLNDLAVLYLDQRLDDKAKPICLQALELTKLLEEKEENHLSFAICWSNLASLYWYEKNYDEAEPLYLQALQLKKFLLGNKHIEIASALHNLGVNYLEQENYSEAGNYFNQALELRRERLGDRHPDVASTLNQLGQLYYRQKNYDEAEPLYVEALNIRKDFLGDKHLLVAKSLKDIGLLYRERGNYDKADSILNQVLELRKDTLGNRHPEVANILCSLGILYRKQKKYRKAKFFFKKAVKLSQQLLGIDHHRTVAYRKELANLHAEMNANNPLLQLHGSFDLLLSFWPIPSSYKAKGRKD